MEPLKYLERKIYGVNDFGDVLNLIVSDLAKDVKPLFIKDLGRVGKVFLLRPSLSTGSY